MRSKTWLLFDTHAFLAFFNGEEGSECIRTYFDAIHNEDTEGFVATVTLAELPIFIPGKSTNLSPGTGYCQVLHSKMHLVPLTAEIAVDAGTIKRPGISVADAIIAASARSVDASVVTNDPHFSTMQVAVI